MDYRLLVLTCLKNASSETISANLFAYVKKIVVTSDAAYHCEFKTKNAPKV
jgi:hypothetical protein